jgi:hypothetical protein
MSKTRRLRSFAVLSVLTGAAVAALSACGDDDVTTGQAGDASFSDVFVTDGPAPSSDASDAGTDTGVDASLARPCTLSNSPVLIASVSAPSSTLSANDDWIYWAGGSGVIRLAKTGGAPQTISSAMGAVVAASNAAACFGLGIEAGTVCTLPDGASPIPVAPGFLHGAWLAGTQLTYVAGADGVVGYVQTDGGGAQALVTAPSSLRVSAVPLSGHVVYGESAEVYSVAVPTPGVPAVVAPAVAAGVVYELVTDGAEVYWSDRGVPAIRRTSGGLNGAGPVTLVNAPYGAGLGHSYGHAVDASKLYAAFRDGVGHGQIASVPKNGVNATATVLDDNLTEAIGLVVDDTCIYYYAERTTDAGMQSGIYGLKKR